MRTLIFIMFLFPTLSMAQGKLTEKNYRIYSVKHLKEISIGDIARDMAGYDVLFFGEEHNDSVAHYLEALMLEALYQEYGVNVVLSLEMFERDVQPVMDEYLKGFIREKHFIKDARTWRNYRDYRPMVEFAKDNGLDVICANAASRYTNLAGREGQKALQKLPQASKEFFAPLPYDTAQGKYHEKLTGLPQHASGTMDTAKGKMNPMPGMGDFNIVMAQSLWDATMAYSISQYWKRNKNKKIMHVNGKFHSDERFAAVAQLKKYSPKSRSLIITTVSDDNFPDISWPQYSKIADYIIITDPQVPKTFRDQ